MINNVFGYRPQFSPVQAPVISANPYVQNAVLPQSYNSLPVGMSSPSSGRSSGFGSWMAPVSQFVGNAAANGYGALMNFGQASGNFLSGLGNSLGSPWLGGLGNSGFYGASMQPAMNVYAPSAVSSPTSFPHVMRNMGTGMKMAMHQIGGFMKDHGPAALAFGGTIAASTAVCAFMGGAAIGTAGVLLGQQMLNRHQ